MYIYLIWKQHNHKKGITIYEFAKQNVKLAIAYYIRVFDLGV